MQKIRSRLNIIIYVLFYSFSSILIVSAELPQPAEFYYTIKTYDSPHFHLESLLLDTESFLELIEQVHAKTHNRAFLIEIPNELYSKNIEKLRLAQFFHYFDFPEHNASVWCRTNGSGIPLAASHTAGARCVVYYVKDSECYFLLAKDKYSFKEYELPGGYIQPEDKEIINNFERGTHQVGNLNYRSPEETAISETLEETGFNLENYGYGPQGIKKPITIAQIYTKNTCPSRGIHSTNDCCQYLLFKVTPNEDPLKKQDHEISDVCWASYIDIINDKIPSSIGVHCVTDHVKQLVQRVVASEKYRENRNKLAIINKKIQEVVSSNKPHTEQLIELTKQQLELIDFQKQLELKLKQSYTQDGKHYITYFTPF